MVNFETYSSGALDHTVMQLATSAGHRWTIDHRKGAPPVVDHFGGIDKDTMGLPGTTVVGTPCEAPGGALVCLNAYASGGNVTLSIQARADEADEWVACGSLPWPNGDLAGIRFSTDEACQWRPVFHFRDAARNVEATSQVLALQSNPTSTKENHHL